MLEFRNRRTSEYKQVDEGTDEHLALLEERGPDSRPVWEQVGRHTRQAFQDRLDRGALDTTDYGDDEQPINRGYDHDTIVNRDELDIKPARDVAHLEPAPVEIEQGAGRAAEGVNLDPRLTGVDSASKNKEGLATADERVRNAQGQSDRDDDNDSAYDYNAEEKGTLQEDADERGLEVKGTGAGGNVTKKDLVKALEADDQGQSDSSDGADGDEDNDRTEAPV